jgi:hypothetical protein
MDGIFSVYSAQLALYGLALRHQFTACSSRLCTLLLTPLSY